MRISASSQQETNRLLLAAALQYAGRGWRVFPLVPQDKTPLTKTGFKEATTDDTRIITWWERWPSANVGLATGNPFDVLDLDGDKGLDSFEEAYPNYRHHGPIAETGNGYHFYFRSSGRKNGVNLLPKVDFRGEGGYVVAPPSIHPKGHSYAWLDGFGPDIPLPMSPDWLTGLTKKRIYGPVVHPSPGAITPVEIAIHHNLRVYWQNPPAIHCPLNTHSDSSPSFKLYPNGTYCFGCQRAMKTIEFLRFLEGSL